MRCSAVTPLALLRSHVTKTPTGFAQTARYAVACFQPFVRFTLLVTCVLMFLPASGIAAEDGGARSVLQFDIPSQALEDALYAFGSATGITVFVDGSNVRGRQSTAVKGSFAATQALRVLLTGTGLNARLVGANAITLAPIPSPERPNSLVYRRYSTDLQNAVLGQLCSDGEARLGTYRIAMQVWVGERGGVQRIELLSSTGDQMRDRRIHELIEGMPIRKPPQNLPQPIVMVILPRPLQDSGDCRAGLVPSSLRDGDGRREWR